MNKQLKRGIYPVMITPYKKNGEVDYAAAAAVAKWYEEKGCQGIFAACLSSEIYFLSEKERLKLIEVTLDSVSADTCVVASGHCIGAHEDMEGCIAALRRVAERGVRSVVLIASKLAGEKDSEQVMLDNAKRIVDAMPDVDFGVYEAPHPYHRLFSPEALHALAQTGRFTFFKDTCCDPVVLREKLDAVKGTDLLLFNANSATLCDSLRHGAAGLSGVMCNYHPELYVKLCALAEKGEWEEAEKLQSFLGMASLVQYQMYPLNAKYYLQLAGLPLESWFCRSRSDCELPVGYQWEVKQMYDFYEGFVKNIFGV